MYERSINWRWKVIVITNLDKKGLPKELVAIFGHESEVYKTQWKRKWKVFKDCFRELTELTLNWIWHLPLAEMIVQLGRFFLLTHTSHNPLAGGCFSLQMQQVFRSTESSFYVKLFLKPPHTISNLNGDSVLIYNSPGPKRLWTSRHQHLYSIRFHTSYITNKATQHPTSWLGNSLSISNYFQLNSTNWIHDSVAA